LKDENDALPISLDESPTIFVAGHFANDIGLQSGGWTIEWQGSAGGITPGTTILEGIREVVGERATIDFDRFGTFDEDEHAEFGIVVVGETPYAEGLGDAADLSLANAQRVMIERMRQRVDTLIVILISGRPMIITGELEMADAFVAAWLPGTEGAGVADVLFGDKPFTGKLSFTWPRSMDQVPLENALTDPLFPFGYGLE
jgi:beta-glucosidase